MTDYRKLTYNDSKIQVDSAIRDGNGVRIDTNYQRKPAVYERTTYSDTSTVCTLIQFNASDYKANGYLAHFRFRVRSVSQDEYPSDNEFIINYSYLTPSMMCTNNKRSATNDIVQYIYAYYPSSNTYLDTGNYFIAFTTGRASTNFVIEVIEADVPYTIPATMSESTTTNTTFQQLTPGNHSSGNPLLWTGKAVGSITGSAETASYATYAGELRKFRYTGSTGITSNALCAVDTSGAAFKLLESGKKFPLPIRFTTPYMTTTAVGYIQSRDYYYNSMSYGNLSDSSIQGGSGFTCPTLTASNGGQPLYVRGTLDTVNDVPVFVPDGNVTLTMAPGYTYIPFGEVFRATASGVPSQFYWSFENATAYTLDANGRLTHVDGGEVRGSGSIQLQNQSVTFTANSDSYASNYPYRASVTQTGVTANTYASVVFSDTQSATGNYANFCRTDTDVIYLYARADVGTQTIPTISIGMDYTDITADNLPIRSDVSARALTLVSSSDSEYSGYPYKYSFTASGCVSTRTANVFFDVSEAISGDWASECETGAGIIYVWSKVAKTNPKLGYVIL